MKATIRVQKEVEIASVLINISPRYIGDGDDDDIPTNFPLLNDQKTAWVASVNIDTGAIAGWPEGEARKMFTKVCDAGTYSLLDTEGNEVAKFDGYVPHGVVPGCYGDYIELDIDERGVITNWPQHPDISEFFDEE